MKNPSQGAPEVDYRQRMNRRVVALAAVLFVVSLGCDKDRPAVPERTQINPRMHVNSTAMTPQVNIDQSDGGGTHIQINGVQVNLPGERAHGAGTTHENE